MLPGDFPPLFHREQAAGDAAAAAAAAEGAGQQLLAHRGDLTTYLY